MHRYRSSQQSLTLYHNSLRLYYAAYCSPTIQIIRHAISCSTQQTKIEQQVHSKQNKFKKYDEMTSISPNARLLWQAR